MTTTAVTGADRREVDLDLARRLTCPFHAWTYDLDGGLSRFPVPEGFEGMRVEEMDLVPLPVAEGHGVVVGRLEHGEAVDADDFLGPALAAEFDLRDFADWPVFLEPHVHRVRANWKIVLDTFRENYHFNYLHRSTLAPYAYGARLTFDAFGPHLRNCSAVRSIDALRGVSESDWTDVERHISPQYALFPNTNITFDARHIELWQVLPVRADECQVLHTVYVRPTLPDDERTKLAEMAPWICETVSDGEDFWVSEQTEPGLRTGLLPGLVIGRNEPALQHLHKGFAAALDDAARGGANR